MKIKFHKSPAFCPAEYDAIIPYGGGYYVGIARYIERGDWHARILSKDLRNSLRAYQFSCRTKRELVSWLNRHQDDLRAATERLDGIS